MITWYCSLKTAWHHKFTCGHDRQRGDGLNDENMSKLLRGNQACLQDSLIKDNEGYIGPFSKALWPGKIQSMVFQHDDPGPFGSLLKRDYDRGTMKSSLERKPSRDSERMS
jgi:hypothetical protein